jgi:hypothetical protein
LPDDVRTAEEMTERLCRELHRRQTHYTTSLYMQAAERIAVQVEGELIGLRCALGLVLGAPAEEATVVALDHYATWKAQPAADAARCACPRCRARHGG